MEIKVGDKVKFKSEFHDTELVPVGDAFEGIDEDEWYEVSRIGHSTDKETEFKIIGSMCRYSTYSTEWVKEIENCSKGGNMEIKVGDKVKFKSEFHDTELVPVGSAFEEVDKDEWYEVSRINRSTDKETEFKIIGSIYHFSTEWVKEIENCSKGGNIEIKVGDKVKFKNEFHDTELVPVGSAFEEVDEDEWYIVRGIGSSTDKETEFRIIGSMCRYSTEWVKEIENCSKGGNMEIKVGDSVTLKKGLSGADLFGIDNDYYRDNLAGKTFTVSSVLGEVDEVVGTRFAAKAVPCILTSKMVESINSKPASKKPVVVSPKVLLKSKEKSYNAADFVKEYYRRIGETGAQKIISSEDLMKIISSVLNAFRGKESEILDYCVKVYDKGTGLISAIKEYAINNISYVCGESKENTELLKLIRDDVAKKIDEKFGDKIAENVISNTVEELKKLDHEEISEKVAEKVISEKSDYISSEIIGNFEKKADKFLMDNYGPIQRRITVQVNDGEKRELKGVLHACYENAMKYLVKDKPIFFTGPAGSGKNVLCQQLAEGLGVPFYFSNAVTQPYTLTGFTDAMGIYHETQFYQAFKNGGLFMLDEMDASIPDALIILNAAIANRYFDFPKGKDINGNEVGGFTKASPNFRVVAAGNTYGLGADVEYVGRNQIDGATLDRFKLMEVGYDRRIEMNLANGDEDLCNFFAKVRENSRNSGIKIIASYRALKDIKDMEDDIPLAELLKESLFKSLGKDDINMLIKNAGGNKYFEAARELLK